MSELVAARLKAPGPKRMLALDGGGTRGIVTIAFLERIESTVRAKLGRPELVLSDYFDMIGGTSVGSMLATMLALGWETAKVRETFETLAKTVFVAPPMEVKHVHYRFRPDFLRKAIVKIVAADKFDTDKLKTGLCIIAKRADSNSVWVMVNNPRARYWTPKDDALGTSEFVTLANSEYSLADLIMASAAAPTYFPPVSFPIQRKRGKNSTASDKKGLFIDGGITPHNNPAWQLFMLATLKGYNLGGADLKTEDGKAWGAGEHELQIISVGTGSFPTIVERKFAAVLEAKDALLSLIHDSEQQALAMLQWFATPRLAWKIDSEMGTLVNNQLAGGKHLTFQRYDIRLEDKWFERDGNGQFKRSYGIPPGEHLWEAIMAARLDKPRKLTKTLKKLQELIEPANVPLLSRLASGAALDQVSPDDFPDAFCNSLWQGPTP